MDWILINPNSPTLPRLDGGYKDGKPREFSIRVLVYFWDRNAKNYISFATYHYGINEWLIEGFHGDFNVTHYMEIKKPPKAKVNWEPKIFGT